MSEVRCQIVRWVCDDQPGFVEAVLVDIDGRRWRFIEKQVYLTTEDLESDSIYPVVGAIPCMISGRETLSDGRAVLVIDTSLPDDLDCDGTTVFRVPAESVTEA